MKRKKTKYELLDALYLNATDISRLFEVSYGAASKILKEAKALDEKKNTKTGYITKATSTSVFKASGYSYDEIKNRIMKTEV